MNTTRLFFILIALAVCINAEDQTVNAVIYADNYFEFYVDGVKIKTDPLDFTPHNAVNFLLLLPKELQELMELWQKIMPQTVDLNTFRTIHN